MKKRITLLILPALLACFLLFFSGCELIDMVLVNVSEVKSADLDDYNGSSVSSDAGVDAGFGYAVRLISSAVPNPMSRAFGSDAPDVARTLQLASPVLGSLVSAETQPRKITAGVNAGMTNETFTGDGGVIITVDEASFKADYEQDKLENPTSMKITFDGKIDAGVSDISGTVYDETEGYIDAEITDSKFNLIAKGNSDVGFTSGVLNSVAYYTAMSVSVGFTLSCSGYSGKYLVSFKYIESKTLTGDSLVSPSSAAENIQQTITVKVYNNDDSEIRSVEYTAQEFAEIISQNIAQ